MHLLSIMPYIKNEDLLYILSEINKIKHYLYTELQSKKYKFQFYKQQISSSCKYLLGQNNFIFSKYKLFFVIDKLTTSVVKNNKFIIEFEYIPCNKLNNKSLVVCAIIISENGIVKDYAIMDITNSRIVIFGENEILQNKPCKLVYKIEGIYNKLINYHIYRIQMFFKNLYSINFQINISKKHFLD